MKNVIKFKFLLFAFIGMGLTADLSMAESYNFSSVNYDEAKKSESFVKFDMASTKVGIFTTEFTGYIKKFSISGNKKGNQISDAVIEFEVKELDTDIDGRNEKMWDHCLDASHNPKIQIKLSQPLEIGAVKKNIPATINVRGENHDINLTVAVNSDMVVDMSGQLSIKDLKIPDPSIVVATVRDTVDISAHLVIKENNQK